MYLNAILENKILTKISELTVSVLYLCAFLTSENKTSTYHESEITSCNKIDKPRVVYRFFGKRYAVCNNTAYIMTQL